MQYHGGKARIGKLIANAIFIKTMEKGFPIVGYVEPFCGMLGVYRYIAELFPKTNQMQYLASDINKSLILMWQALQQSWKPPTRLIDRTEFMKLKYNEDSSAEKGYIGHFYGYMGKYFVTFDNRRTQKQADETSNIMTNMGQRLQHVMFSTGDYKMHSSLRGFVVYCDSPYKESSRYYQENAQSQPKFNHDMFWEWCREMSKNNLVFISAYSAPFDFTEIFSIVSQTPRTSRVEKLFVHSSFQVD